MGKIKSYTKEVLARITGDKDQVIAEKNYRKASAQINGQIASLQSKLVEDEQRVEDAQDKLNEAKYPTTLVDGDYLNDVVEANDQVEYAQAVLDETNKSIAFYKALLADFEKEVDA